MDSKHYDIALQWLKLAVKQNFPNAQYNMGVLYANGWGVPQSREQALKWFLMASDQGYEPAKQTLRSMGVDI
jgi:hypothetical protein